MSRLLLARHGETSLNSARKFMGHNDVGLSALGFRQVRRLGDRLAKERIDFIYSSDLKRALVTAETVASHHGLEVITCPELREINYGKVEGLKFEEIRQLHPAVAELCVEWSPRLKFPDGESVDELNGRVNQFLDRLKKHTEEETILIVAHGGPLRLMVCSLLQIDMGHWRQINVDLASLSIVDTYPEIAIVQLLNDTSHLQGLEV